jgi:hypothetical protein
MINEITSISDVEYFFNYLINEESLNFHPDEDFRNYIHLETGLPSYSIPEAILRNRLLSECFQTCEKEGVDIYQIGHETL